MAGATTARPIAEAVCAPMMIISVVTPDFGNRAYFLTGRGLIAPQVMPAPTPRS